MKSRKCSRQRPRPRVFQRCPIGVVWGGPVGSSAMGVCQFFLVRRPQRQERTRVYGAGPLRLAGCAMTSEAMKHADSRSPGDREPWGAGVPALSTSTKLRLILYFPQRQLNFSWLCSFRTLRKCGASLCMCRASRDHRRTNCVLREPSERGTSRTP